ncbi:MAG: leucine-rich repeat domain-containing protein [Eggerthellaceae bacterium]|nr:leucine-rich repeat domain-containing protein [Eggerthellaceae bacterium]
MESAIGSRGWKVAALAAVLAVALLVAAALSPASAQAAQGLEAGAAGESAATAAQEASYALLTADGFLERCDSKGNAAGEAWHAESDREAIYALADVETVFIAADVKEVNRFALRYQTGAGAVNVANNYTSLYQFSALPSLRRVAFAGESSAVTVRPYAFQACKNLESIAMPASMRRIGTFAFYGCNNLSKVKLGQNLEVIEGGAFYDCISLERIAIPASVDSVQGSAFHGCYQLAKVSCANPAPPTLGPGAFDGASSKLKISVPKSAYSMYCSQWSSYADKIADPRSKQSLELEVLDSFSVDRSKLTWSTWSIPSKAIFKLTGAKGSVTYSKVSPSSSQMSESEKGAIALHPGLQV